MTEGRDGDWFLVIDEWAQTNERGLIERYSRRGLYTPEAFTWGLSSWHGVSEKTMEEFERAKTTMMLLIEKWRPAPRIYYAASGTQQIDPPLRQLSLLLFSSLPVVFILALLPPLRPILCAGGSVDLWLCQDDT